MARLLSTIMGIVHSIYSGKNAKPKEFTVQDFMPNWLGNFEEEKPEVKVQSLASMKAALYAMAGMNKGQKRTKRKKTRRKK